MYPNISVTDGVITEITTPGKTPAVDYQAQTVKMSTHTFICR